ncbi:MAG TPA: uroporphyrinogen decarboxylase family protein [Desulfatiglandales bacterium]|nr:uroporphyrinogen decarboxylase family protein [Desulfatiglandales bacterium]
MNIREKFLSVINFDKEAVVPNWEFGYWYDTVTRWYNEGLHRKNPPAFIKCSQWIYGEADPALDVFQEEPNYYGEDVKDYFGFDERVHAAPLYAPPLPLFDKEIYEEDEENITYKREDDGKIVKTRKDGTSMPLFLEFPVKNRFDFEKMKERFNPQHPGRVPHNLDKKIREYKERDYVLQIGGTLFSGFFSILREMMGLETTLINFYDDPKLIIDMLEFFTDYYIKLNSKVTSKVEVDYIYIWEDMSYKNGPFISPELFRKYILPYYKRFTSAMADYGVKNFFVDTDGNCEKLIPLFIEGGVTGLLPFEVNAGMDVEKVRAQYPRLIIMGGIDKTALSKGKDSIKKEIEKAKRMIGIGGYIPYTDHAVQPDVSFDNYKFYRESLAKLL